MKSFSITHESNFSNEVANGVLLYYARQLKKVVLVFKIFPQEGKEGSDVAQQEQVEDALEVIKPQNHLSLINLRRVHNYTSYGSLINNLKFKVIPAVDSISLKPWTEKDKT